MHNREGVMPTVDPLAPSALWVLSDSVFSPVLFEINLFINSKTIGDSTDNSKEEART